MGELRRETTRKHQRAPKRNRIQKWRYALVRAVSSHEPGRVIDFQDVLGAIGIVLQRGKTIHEASAAAVDEEPGGDGWGRQWAQNHMIDR